MGPVCRQKQILVATLNRWRNKFGMMEVALFGLMIETVKECFAVNRDELRRKFATEVFRKGNEANIEGLGIDGTEDASESVIAGDAAGEIEEFSQPGFFVSQGS